MSSIDHVRALLRDRQVKAGARGTDEVVVCLDTELVTQHQDLLAQLAALEANEGEDEQDETRPQRRRLGDRSPDPDTSSEDSGAVATLKAQIAEVEDSIRAACLRLVFVSLGSTGYQAVLNRHPSTDDGPEERAAWMNDLTSATLKEVWSGDERVDVTWDEIRPALTYGEWDSTVLRAWTLNRQKVDAPFSLRSSGTTRG